MAKKRRKYLKALGALIILTACLVLGINFYIKGVTAAKIVTAEQAVGADYDCILILGCGVLPSGKPTAMLEDRLLKGLELYEAKAASKIIVSGDHGRIEYDEVNTMKNFLTAKGVPSEDIFMDHAGFSTYESVYRARDIFEAEKIIIVTQQYHLYRALYLAESLDLQAVGVSADLRQYRGETYRELREIAARDKDFFFALFKPEPTFLGESIPVWGDGNQTND